MGYYKRNSPRRAEGLTWRCAWGMKSQAGDFCAGYLAGVGQLDRNDISVCRRILQLFMPCSYRLGFVDGFTSRTRFQLGDIIPSAVFGCEQMMVRRRCDMIVLSDFAIRLVMSRRGYELDSLFPFGAGVRSVLSAEDAVAGAASSSNSCSLLRATLAIPWEWGRVPGLSC